MTAAEAIAQLVFAVGWNGGRVPVFVNGGVTPRFSVADSNSLAKRAALLDFRDSAEVAIGLPRTRGLVKDSTILWAWVRGSEQERRAHRFRQVPSMVLRMGRSSERLLIWMLRDPAPYVSTEAANAKLAYHLHAPRTRSKIETLRIPLPGTFLRVGRARPVPVLVTRAELEDYTREQLVGRLKDPPPPDAWKDRAGRGRNA